MGTMIALLLVLGTLSGCAGGSMTNVKNAMPEALEDLPAYVVELSEWSGSRENDQGDLMVACSYQIPVLNVLDKNGLPLTEAHTPEEARALQTAAAFNAQFDQWRDGSPMLDELWEDAETFEETFQFTATMTDELICSVYQSDHFISVSGNYYGYSGGAHGNTILLSWNFDLETGSFFDSQLLENGTDLQKAVCQELEAQAEAKAAEAGLPPEEYFWADYADILAEWSSYAVSFDKSGMTVGFSPYELACYAAGPQVFHLSYDSLRPHLGREARLFLGLDP